MSIFTKKTDEQKCNDEKYKQTLACVEKCMTEVIMNYFIFNISIVLNNKEIEHTKIKEECFRFNIIVYEENLKLYDIENNVKINKYDDLLIYDTKICKIIIVPFVLD
jgi:hypothetical protein